MSLPHRCLSRKGYIIHKKEIDKKTEKKIIRDLTVKPQVLPAYKEFVKPRPYKIYFQNDSSYYLPRYYAVENFGSPLFTNFAKSKEINIECRFGPLDFQKTAVSKLDDAFNREKYPLGNGGVLCVPCGHGKTYMSLRTACNLGLKTLVVVNKEFLMDQWVEAIKKFTTASVGIIQQNRVEVDHDIVIAMIHSLCMKNYPPKTFADFGLIILDEVHHLSSEVFCKTLLKVRPPFTLGLSATPERQDGLSHVFYKFIGPILHQERRTGTNRVIVKQILITSTSTHYQTLFMANNTKNTAGMATAISEFPAKNKLLFEILKMLIKQNRTILLLSSRRAHLHEMKDMLDEARLAMPDGRAVTYGFYYGKQGGKKSTHREMLSLTAGCDIILGTDAIAKEGLDIPSLNTLVFGTPPGMNVEQSVGRILRKHHEKIYPMVVDLVDKTGNFTKHASERNKWYAGEDYDVQKLKIQLYDDQQLNKYDDEMFSFLNKKVVKSKKIELEDKPPPEPTFDECILDMPAETKLKKVVFKAKGTVLEIKKKKFNYKEKNPKELPDDCLLADETIIKRRVLKRKVKPADPFGDECLI